jgi:hypothetical protein
MPTGTCRFRTSTSPMQHSRLPFCKPSWALPLHSAGRASRHADLRLCPQRKDVKLADHLALIHLKGCGYLHTFAAFKPLPVTCTAAAMAPHLRCEGRLPVAVSPTGMAGPRASEAIVWAVRSVRTRAASSCPTGLPALRCLWTA